nr:class I SAM-dependent methyltransferase [uncultured Cohaesibacter sp.]
MDDNSMTSQQPSICPICSNGLRNQKIVSRPNAPVLQNVTLSDRARALAFPTGRLEFMRCDQCGFVWNEAFDPDLIHYDSGYNNDVSSSAYYRAHLEEMADNILAAVPQGKEIHYVEIGCGDGEFLRLVVERAKGRCVSAVGFDPSYNSSKPLPQGARIHPTIFSPETCALVPEKTNIVCSRHTIEHIADVQMFARSLSSLITNSERKLFIETPDMDWILEHVAFQDFFYEHCALYTPRAIATLLAQYGMTAKTRPVYFGQYMWTEATLAQAKPADGSPAAPSHLPAATPELADAYRQTSERSLRQWHDFIKERRAAGPIALWGGASKGVTFALLIQSLAGQEPCLDCVIDLNKAKQSCFLPVTGLPIVSPETARQRQISTIIVMNPNYLDEIRDMVERMDWPARIVALNE